VAHDGLFEEMDAAECVRLVKDHIIGRVGFVRDGRVLVIPVTYGTDGDQVLFRTSPSSVLGRLADGADVSFQVDEYDVETASGWSVLAHGRARSFEDGHADTPTPWAPGRRTQVIAIKLTHLAGRVVSRGTAN